MRIKTYRFAREFELNLIGKVWSFRIGTHQVALWRNYRAIFSFRRGMRTGESITPDPLP